ncbi:hypothetical protein EKO04_010103 [Ascochyta lentis]|uniref:Protein kinase domain-containing protein n=1 Tax=Ascochyta lentis TaxID=205686 RepID=A0A8H7MDI4_9PLEO|nr:hypothetical protein EKO04_010103 [Ascochyta lentis]
MEGAGFAFDTADMDFNNVFATMPQQQQSFAKPNEDNTPGFFFGDEGIDTTGSFVDPSLFSTPSQDMSYLSQSLAMDNTMGNASMWNSHHLTPESLVLNSFPATPTQPLEMYQPGFGSSLGKRPLQLDVEDFPQSKRHESMGDYTALSSFSSTASPQMEVIVGLSDEAADVCATWFNKYAVLPSDRHIESLSQLTGESSDAIRQWFGRMLKQGMGGHDSAYKSQTDMMQPALCWSDSYTADLIPQQQQTHQPTPQLTQEDTATPERRSSNDTVTISQSTSNLRGGKKRCTPTDDRELLSRDPNKIYQCTRKCGKRYGRKCDWKRNEEEGYPCKSWVCSLCTSGGVENVRPCFRKYHFVQHFRNIHPEVDSDEYEQTSIVCSETEFPRNCGFCKHRFDSRQDRIDHIADHFKQGKCMLDWNENSDDNGQDDDDNNGGDDDDKPSGDGNDGAPSQPPPESDPGGDDFGCKYFGGGDYGGGGSGSSSESLLPPSSFFQFQSSSGSGDVDITKQLQGGQQPTRQRARSSSEPRESSSLQDCISTEQCSTHEQHASTARDDQTSMAGDALSGLLVGGAKFPSQPLVARGVCLSDDGVGLVTAAANRTPLNSYSNAPGQNTNASPTKSLTQHQSEDRFVAIPAVLGAPVDRNKTSLSSTAVLDTVQNFTPHSFLSVRLLGAGGFSTVDEVLHRATNLRLGRKTLKNRDQSAIEDLKKEVSVLQKLRHPHVIRFLGAYSNGDKMSILVSPVAETTLALWLEQTTLQQPANFVNVVSKMFGCLLSSIRYLHEQRPVVKHMDIKPQNILVAQGDQEFPHVVLCDFGISSSDDLSDGQHKPLTRRYVAPEVLEGLTRKEAADIWSLGCVFAEMASAPFAQSNSNWLAFRHEYSGRTGKHYWQDVPSLQDRLSSFLEEAATPTEQLVVGTLKDMLHADPNERPSAALLSLRFTPAPCCLEWPNDKAVFPAPDQELEAVDVLVHQDGVNCCDRRDHSASGTDEHSQDVFKNAKCWIEECAHAHDACRQYAKTDRTLPTRLVDTQPEGIDDGIVRVVDSTSVVQGPEAVEYATLSYVWEQTDVTLTTDQLENAQLGLQRHALPKPLESGIQAAQNLGYRYIWIDSLCILQDSEDDKRSECAKMASVFRNAALTIVLDQVEKLRSEKPAVIETSPSVVPPNANANTLTQNATRTSSRQSAVAVLPTSDFFTPGFGWDTRAWALQERLLSRRLLHICERQLYWECSSLKASDTFPQGLSPLVWEKAHSKPHHDRIQRGKSGQQSVVIKNALDRHTLEPTHLRNCQWIHKEGNDNKDSMTPAHTTTQGEDAKAPLSSQAVFSQEDTRIKSAVNATCSTNASIGAYNAGSGPWTGTTAVITSTDQPRADPPTIPNLNGPFALSGDPTSAHPPLSKAYRGSETTPADAHIGRLVVDAAHPQLSSHTHTCSQQPPSPATTTSDSLAHTLAHQLASGTHSHPCAGVHRNASQTEAETEAN